MSLAVDFVIIGLVLLGAVIGAYRGLIRSISKPVRVVTAFMAAVLLSASVGATTVQPRIQEPIENQIADYLVDKCENLTTESLPTMVKIAASVTDTDIDQYLGETSEESAVKIASAVSEPTSRLISQAIAFIGLFLIVSLALGLFFIILDRTFSKGTLGVINRTLGFIVSGAFSVLIAWALCVAFTFVLSTPALHDSSFARNFVPGKVYSFFRDLDPVRVLLSF